MPLSFSTPYLYSGTLFAGVPELVECADQGQTLLGACRNLRVCVVQGTTTERVVSVHLDGVSLTQVSNTAGLFEELAAGNCNVLAGDPINLYASRAREAGFTGDYVYGSKSFSKEHL